MLKLGLGLALLSLLGCGSAPGAWGVPIPPGNEAFARPAATKLAFQQPTSFFRTQEQDPAYHPETAPADNANCGPASLAMALLAYGVAPSGDTDPAHAQELILAARQALTGAEDQFSWTYPAEFAGAAAHFGLSARIVNGVDGVLAACEAGHLVVVNVNPSPAYTDQLAHPCDGGHFALVTGMAGDKVYLNDPLGARPIVITREQLMTALSTDLGPGIAPFGGGIEIWRNPGVLAAR